MTTSASSSTTSRPATDFFVRPGLEVKGDPIGRRLVGGGVVGLDGVHVDFAFMQTPDGHGRLELIKFRAPSHQGGNGDALLRPRPRGIIIELVEEIGG